ncbi:hypothetical protein OKW98_06900 [Pseudomonas sp. KU26590]|uniref:hypothetical protein n=1 Tax=Pseudomonas sp. KU26590 TaxID=2991051 RepID=UPI00223CC73B|nr:hypothetical protein [Pseudomonas sp. KU26590]UZJ61439.1 hypothetical protein OKW98_06900 [Pseudomonas sp. KU26590]
MSDRQHQTDIFCTYKAVTAGPQKKHWVEFQLVDELGKPLANLPWRDGCVPEYTGITDAEGVIRLEDLYPLDMTLLMPATPLAQVLPQRRLRAVRPEPDRPGFGESTPLYGEQRSGFSPVEKTAHEQGHDYHYLRIGQLCDGLPVVRPELAKRKPLPVYHFPDASFSGFTAPYEALDRRHVLDELERNRLFLVMHEEVCAALEVTRQAEGGPEALLRLDASVSTSGAWNV